MTVSRSIGGYQRRIIDEIYKWCLKQLYHLVML
jgi:hypothetical protein